MNIKLFKTIDEVPKKEWDMLNRDKNDIFVTWKLMKIIEKSFPKDEHIYALVYMNNKPVGKALFTITQLNVFNLVPLNKRKFLKIILKLLRKKEVYKIIYAGIPLNLPITSFRATSKKSYNLLIKALNDLYLKRKDVKIAVLGQFSQKEKKEFENYKETKTYNTFQYIPTYVLKRKFKSFHEYINSMKGKYSRHIKKSLQKSKELEINTIDKPLDFFMKHPILFELYEKVCDRANYQFYRSNRDFFINILKDFKDYITLHVIRKDKKIISFALNFENDNEIFSYHEGSREDENKKYSLYFNLYNYRLKRAFEEGKKYNFLQTTDYVKKRYGGERVDGFIFVNIKNKIFNYILNKIFISRKYNKEIDVFKKKVYPN